MHRGEVHGVGSAQCAGPACRREAREHRASLRLGPPSRLQLRHHRRLAPRAHLPYSAAGRNACMHACMHACAYSVYCIHASPSSSACSLRRCFRLSCMHACSMHALNSIAPRRRAPPAACAAASALAACMHAIMHALNIITPRRRAPPAACAAASAGATPTSPASRAEQSYSTMVWL